MLNRVLALLALLYAPDCAAQSTHTPDLLAHGRQNCTRDECAVRASELDATFEVQAHGYNLPAGCLLFEHDVSSGWGCWRVIYVEQCAGDNCGSVDCPCDEPQLGGCPCTTLACHGSPTASPTSPTPAPTSAKPTLATVERDVKKGGHWSGTRRWWFSSSLIVLACAPCCAFVASKRRAAKERVSMAAQVAGESELVHVAALEPGAKGQPQLEL